MSSHTGVSCDACMRSNFTGRRYKCLLCDNYDLCGSCYDAEAESQNHKNDHPMQCILTDTAFELFYAGESIPRRTVVSFTCPHCGLAGFIPRTLLIHCAEKHSSSSSQTKYTQAVMCPICVTSTTHKSRSRYTLLTDHLVTVHDDGSAVDDDDLFSTLTVSKTRRPEDEEEDSDEDDEDDDQTSTNDHEHRAFIEEEHRRQEVARQRLAHASSLAAAIRNEYAASLNGNSNAQRRPLIRQTAIRGIRGGLRGPTRPPSGLSSATSSRNSSETSAGTSSQNTPSTDPYAAYVFGQDPMLEFVSRLVTNQQPSATSNAQFLFAPSVPIPVPSSVNTTTDFARLQQQIENNEPITTLKTTLLNSRQKRSSQGQQQSQPTGTSQTMLLANPLSYDYSIWQQSFPALQSTINDFSFVTGTTTNNATKGTNNSSSRTSQQVNREFNPGSLLDKMLRNDRDVNNDEMNETRMNQIQNHISFLQSILLSTTTTNLNEEQSESELIVNKENLQ